VKENQVPTQFSPTQMEWKKKKWLSNFHFNPKQSVRESGDRSIFTSPPHKVKKSNGRPILIPPINGMRENLATAQFLFHPHMKWKKIQQPPIDNN
jgi:hypothetical protein